MHPTCTKLHNPNSDKLASECYEEEVFHDPMVADANAIQVASKTQVPDEPCLVPFQPRSP